MVMAGVTTKYVFDLQPGDVYWCTADCGWITGHTYLTYGPLLNGAQNVIFEGVPTYPDASRCWQIVQKHKVCNFAHLLPVCSRPWPQMVTEVKLTALTCVLLPILCMHSVLSSTAMV